MTRNIAIKGTVPNHLGLARDSSAAESPGLWVARICPACGLEKKPGSSHPKCSRKLQKMHQQGLLPKRKL